MLKIEQAYLSLNFRKPCLTLLSCSCSADELHGQCWKPSKWQLLSFLLLTQRRSGNGEEWITLPYRGCAGAGNCSCPKLFSFIHQMCWTSCHFFLMLTFIIVREGICWVLRARLRVNIPLPLSDRRHHFPTFGVASDWHGLGLWWEVHQSSHSCLSAAPCPSCLPLSSKVLPKSTPSIILELPNHRLRLWF